MLPSNWMRVGLGDELCWRAVSLEGGREGGVSREER